MKLQVERAYGLHLPPKERVNFLLKDLTQEQLQKRPIAGFVWDIIKWLELAEGKATEDALEAADKRARELCPCCEGEGFFIVEDQRPGPDPNDPEGEPIPYPVQKQIECAWCGTLDIRALMPKEKSDG